jgi:hypothetical protein
MAGSVGAAGLASNKGGLVLGPLSLHEKDLLDIYSSLQTADLDPILKVYLDIYVIQP